MNLGIRSRLFLTSVGVLAFAGGLGAFYLQNELRSLLESQTETDIVHLAKAGRQILEVSASTAAPDYDSIADRLGHATDSRITIVLSNGVVVGDSALSKNEIAVIENHGKRPEILAAKSEDYGLSWRYSTTLKTKMLYAAVLFEAPYASGVVRSALPLESIDTVSKKLWFLMGVAGLIGLALATMIIFLASHWTMVDLRRVVLKAQMISRGSSISLRPQSQNQTNEIGFLEGSINLLGEQLEQYVSQLGDERDRFETVLREMNDAVVALDGSGLITVMNEEASLLLDLPSSAVGRSLSDFVRLPGIMDLVKAGQERPTRAEFSFGEESRTVQAHARPLRSSDGLVLVMHDVSEIRRLERMRKDFVANVSHELRTPVSVIHANAETLLDGGLSDPEHAPRFVEAQLRSAKRLTALIDDILDLSKIEAGKYSINMERISLIDIVQDVIGPLQASADKKNITIRSYVLSADMVTADAKALVHVLSNFIDNAIKYGPLGGMIEVGIEHKIDHVTVFVQDNGPGIAEEHQERIFERFYRVDTGRSREAGGTGLGLAICKNLIEAMSGEVGYKTRTGGGSRFWFRLKT